MSLYAHFKHARNGWSRTAREVGRLGNQLRLCRDGDNAISGGRANYIPANQYGCRRQSTAIENVFQYFKTQPDMCSCYAFYMCHTNAVSVLLNFQSKHNKVLLRARQRTFSYNSWVEVQFLGGRRIQKEEKPLSVIITQILKLFELVRDFPFKHFPTACTCFYNN